MPRTTAAANAAPMPTSSHRHVMFAYLEWLWNEQVAVCRSIGYTEGVYAPLGTPARKFHFPLEGEAPYPAATRAIAVMDAAGVDLGSIRNWAQRRAKEEARQDREAADV